MVVKILVGAKNFRPNYIMNISIYQQIFLMQLKHITIPTDSCSNLTGPEINKGTQWMERAASKEQSNIYIYAARARNATRNNQRA